MKKAVAAVGSAMALVALGATPALADDADRHIVLYSDDGETNCFDKDVAIVIPNPTNDDVTYICFDYPP